MRIGIKLCLDCHQEPEYYMVSDALWCSAFPSDAPCDEYGKPIGQLCFHCLERRLKRCLIPDDFPADIPVNRGVFGFDRFKSTTWYVTERVVL